MMNEYRSPREVKIGDATLHQLIINHKHWLSDREHPGIDPSAKERFVLFSNISELIKLENIDFSEYECLDFTFSILGGVSFNHCKFGDSVLFHRSSLDDIVFENCKFGYKDICSFDGSVLNKCVFANCDFGYNTRFIKTCFRKCKFYDCFIDAYLGMADFIDCTFDTTKFGNNITINGSILNNGNEFNYCSNIPYVPMSCPSEGAFIGWKKVQIDTTKIKYMLVKLQIPASAKRSSALSNKCRCDKAKVLGIYNLDGTKSEIRSVTNITRSLLYLTKNEIKTEYEVGKYVYPDSFDEDRWEECTHGIHFFMNKQDAIEYGP